MFKKNNSSKAGASIVAAACFSLFLSGAGWASKAPSDQPPKPKYSAAMNYQLHCEGCHKADGAGQPGFIPDFRGNVSRFLRTSEGRAYLAGVPGAAQSLLSDKERADVLNWIVHRFDPANIPVNFSPYTAAEVSRWRANALSQPTAIRGKLMAELDDKTLTQAVAPSDTVALIADPPAAYAICAACHTTSGDGSHGIGPNLRGIVDRAAGGAAGFSYSPAITKSGIKWTRADLDAFLKSPNDKVPGSLMSLDGIADPTDRAAIIDYLAGLR